MRSSEYQNIYKNEQTHFFYKANHALVINLVKKYLSEVKNPKILEAGCGTGLLAKKLSSFGVVEAIDISPEAVKLAKKRGIRAKIASVGKIPFKSSQFDLVTSIDVIYHKKIKSDKIVLNEFSRVLKPGGILIIRVPANKWLTRSTDAHVHTRERYELNNLAKKLKAAKFKVKKISYVNLILLPPAIISWIWEKIATPTSTRSPLPQLPQTANFIAFKHLLFENYLLNFINLPFGLGIIAVCQKPLS